VRDVKTRKTPPNNSKRSHSTPATRANTNMTMFKFIEQLKQVTKEQFNPLDKSNSMSKLFNKNQNAINTITTLQRYPQKIET
jgi:hypothetical protein